MLSLLPLLKNSDEPLYVVHGNGPQVGQELLRQDEAARHLPGNPLDACVASTQGWMGYILENTIRSILQDQKIDREVTTLLSQVEVDGRPRISAADEANRPLLHAIQGTPTHSRKGWVLHEDAGRGYRMVVPSPRPKAVLGVSGARVLSDQGYIVIVGGGRSPSHPLPTRAIDGSGSCNRQGPHCRLIGEKVGASRFILVTGVPEVRIHFGTPDETPLRKVTLKEMIAYQKEGHFPAGSMGPKIGAAIEFLESGGKDVLITSPSCIGSALVGKAGTHIVVE